MLRKSVSAGSAAGASLAISAALLISAPTSANAQDIQIVSGASRTLAVGGILPPGDAVFLTKTDNSVTLTQFQTAEIFFLPFATSLSAIDAFASSGSITNNGHFLSTSITGDLSTFIPDPPRAPDLVSGNFTTGAIANVTGFDTLGLFTDNPDDHRSVTLHKTLFLEGGASDSLFLNDAVTNQDFRASGSSSLSVSGDGIGLNFGSTIYASFDMAEGTDISFHSSESKTGVIDFALHLNLNEFRNFQITMAEQEESDLLDLAGGGISQFGVTAGYSLVWSGDSFVTDDQSGDFLHGMVAGADSGFNYIGQDVGGAGEDLNAPPAATSVPEPATWALMLGGFGIVGAVLRRRRLADVPLAARA